MCLIQRTNCAASCPLYNRKDMPTHAFFEHQSSCVGAHARLDSGLVSECSIKHPHSTKIQVHRQRRSFIFDFLSAAICIKSYYLVYYICLCCFLSDSKHRFQQSGSPYKLQMQISWSSVIAYLRFPLMFVAEELSVLFVFDMVWKESHLGTIW